MKAFSVAILFSIFTNPCFSQSDTTFFDSAWKNCKRSEAKYYRLVSKAGDKFIVRDIFINNKPQMTAVCSSVEPYIRNGKCTEYRENGTIMNTGYYTNEKQSGMWTWYDEDGKDSTIGEWREGDIIYILNKGHYVDIRGKKQFVITEGSGNPTVVFLTGKGDAQYNYANVYQKIKKTTQIFAYDRAGLGNSESLNNQRTVDTMAYELNELLVKEKIKPPFILVGHSLGGWVIRCFTKMYPKKVAGLIFIDSASELDFKKGLEVRNDSDKIKYREKYKSYLDVPSRTKGQNDESKYTFDFDENNYSSNSNIVKDIKIPNNIPITVFLSVREDTSVPYAKETIQIRKDSFESWKKQAPQMKLITTSKSGHYIHEDEPNLIIDGINNMLNELKGKAAK